MQAIKQMKQFMEPQSVALVGVSRHTGEGASNILENLLGYGYKGRIYPINPNVSEILGITTYSSVTEVPDNIDLAVIATPRHLVPRLARECASREIKAIVIVAQGFSDAIDEEGKRLQQEIDQIVRSNQIRIVGPNTFGTSNAFINFSSSFIRINMEKRPIGVICQTGVFFVGFPEVTLIGKGIDLGNACDISFADGLEYFEHDTEVNVIALHIEGMRDTERFINTAKRVSRYKPVIVLKTGKSQQAAMAAQSHTGSLTGAAEAWQAAFKQSGVLQAADLQEFIDLVRTFSVLPPMKKSTIGVITISGGLGVLAIDACQESKVRIDRLSLSTRKLLNDMSPSWMEMGNPVDIWPAMMLSQSAMSTLVDGLKVLLSAPEVGAVMFIAAAFDERWQGRLCQLLAELRLAHRDKPITCCIYGPCANATIKDLEQTAGVVAFGTPERAIRALARLNEYSNLTQEALE